jgi:hypothetical protein
MPPQKQRITLKSIEEIIKELTPKVPNLNIYDRYSHGARRKYPKDIILLAQSLKEDYHPNLPNKNKFKYPYNHNISIYLYNIH